MKHDKIITEILNSKEFKSIKPISDSVREKCRKESSRYMLFYNKNAEDGTCERCGTASHFSKTKHKTEIVGPKCKHKMIVEHTWRRQGCDYHLDWFMDIKAISDEVVVLRYIMVHQFESYDKQIGEVAREVFDFKNAKHYKLGYKSVTTDGHERHKEWVLDNYYFIESNMCWVVRNAWCQAADFIMSKKKICRELSKIKAIQYYDWESKLGSYYLLSNDIEGLLRAPLYEKMEKVGLKQMADDDFGRGRISFNPNETSIVKMLRLDKKHYNLFMESKNIIDLQFLQMYRAIPEAEFRWVRDNHEYSRYHQLRRLKIKHPITAMNYVKRKKVNWRDYIDYLTTMKKGLGYDMNDKSYIYPSDFKKADERVQEEFIKKQEEERARADAEKLKQLQKRDGAIKEISDALRAMPDLQKFLDGSNGFLVYVPENANDFMDESRALHNCISTYVNRVADKKTLLFFIRKLDCPDAPFVAMEYCNGEIIQARYDRNDSIYEVEHKDDNLINFVDALAATLRKNKVMVA